MKNEMIQIRNINMGENLLPTLSWMNKIESKSVVSIRNKEVLLSTLDIVRRLSCPLPLIISLCPAIINLDAPNSLGQTRELVELSFDNMRLTNFVEELFELNKMTLNTLGVPIETMMVFADILEKDSSKMFTNTSRWTELATSSSKNISTAFANFEKLHPNAFFETKFKIPKIRLQSNVIMQAGKAGLRHEDEMRKIELDCLDPKSNTFELFIKHLKLTAETPFVATGFQTIRSAETVWNRVRFMLAQCVADGIVLPKIFNEMHKKSFGVEIPRPLFVCSTTRLGGIELEMDSFEVGNNSTIAIFNSIGSWMKD